MNQTTVFALKLFAAVANSHAGAANGPSLDMMAAAAVPASISRATPPRAASLDDALARLPEASGAVAAVRERYYPNGYSQDIALESDVSGRINHIAIAIQSGRALASSEKAPVWKPGEAGIRDELAREFPNLAMHVVVNGGFENGYGRFGVAIGRDGEALRCIYAWQYVDDARRAFDHGTRIALDGVEAAPAALRVKLCRADATVDDLVGYVKALRVDVPETYAAAPPVALRVSSAPAAAIYAPPHTRSQRVAHRVWRPRAVARVARPPAEAYAPAYAQPGYAPPVYPAAAVAVPVPQPVAVAPYGAPVAAPQAVGGPRYLAPVAAGAAVTTLSGATGLSRNLPAAAYRGPTNSHPPAEPGAPAAQNPYRREVERSLDKGPVGSISSRNPDAMASGVAGAQRHALGFHAKLNCKNGCWRLKIAVKALKSYRGFFSSIIVSISNSNKLFAKP